MSAFKPVCRAAVVCLAAVWAAAAPAQDFAGGYPVVPNYLPPPQEGVWLPAMHRLHPSYFMPPVSYYPVQNRWVGPAHATAYIVAPARVSFGPFGRTYVRTPYWRAGF
jgi:hypothetical protein